MFSCIPHDGNGNRTQGFKKRRLGSLQQQPQTQRKKKSGVDQSRNHVMLQNVLQGGGRVQRWGERRRGERSVCVFFFFLLSLPSSQNARCTPAPAAFCGCNVRGRGCLGDERANNTVFAYLLIDRRQSHFDLSSLIALCG